ncbi:uncharacterized protein LOC129920544 isoform X8 [Episyrphus balteatus]|uniref:uncharacterized protein LOC129920544 isoform X8 n=1 Tax=Episyrphus balteatus TaxID=286459 RepID=UPI00248676D2|nr:uncharacterized protein LOC129920544 isoform X8 [Episyrphus balteatus]
MSKHFALQFIIIFSTLIRLNNSANVLCMFTSPVKNQIYIFMGVANTLIERGHNVTIVTIIPIPNELIKSEKPFRHIFLKTPPESIRTLNNQMMELDEFASKFKIIRNIILIFNLFPRIQENALKTVIFQEFLKEDNHFDLMVLGYFHNDFIVGVAARYRCAIAVVSLAAPYGAINRMVGNPAETSYVQIPFFGKSQPMSFLERTNNVLWSGLEPLLEIYVNYQMEQSYR